MNIFILDDDMHQSAIYHADKHCVKMILEHSQMLCTALMVNTDLQTTVNATSIPYKKSHAHHPCTIWVSKSYDNFAWLVAYTHHLHEEYKYRYAREHLSYVKLKSDKIITDAIIMYGSSLSILDLNPVSVMPTNCKIGSVVENYRSYYRQYKSQLFNWTKRDKPHWL